VKLPRAADTNVRQTDSVKETLFGFTFPSGVWATPEGTHSNESSTGSFNDDTSAYKTGDLKAYLAKTPATPQSAARKSKKLHATENEKEELRKQAMKGILLAEFKDDL